MLSPLISSIISILGLKNDFVFPSINCEDLHPEISLIVAEQKIPKTVIDQANIKIVAKAGFGFGDVNCCTIFKKYEND